MTSKSLVDTRVKVGQIFALLSVFINHHSHGERRDSRPHTRRLRRYSWLQKLCRVLLEVSSASQDSLRARMRWRMSYLLIVDLDSDD
jgi:hypothetical protein